ncbi:MAG: hypothetical protein B6I31_04150 [Desulfobacteraceae bacterium 4572_19]|nr:MAG: hypothetical protein B6I31_04150 [Desulfobacteraceae bacterium 4572_19]
MLVTNIEYDKMIEDYNFKDFPEIENEIREKCTDRFKNHSEPSENKLIGNRPGSKSLQIANNFFGDI